MTRLVDCANAYLPWKRRVQWLIDTGWTCSPGWVCSRYYNTTALSTKIFWYSPHQKHIYSSSDLATMSAEKFRKLVAKNFVWFFLLKEG